MKLCNIMGLNSYKVPRPGEIKTGAQPHTDKSFLTILDQNQVGGLEVKLKDSDEWCMIEFLPSSIVVMAGEGLVAWSNNRITAPVPRVTMNGKVKRYSVGLFSFHTGIIHTLEELIDEDHPRRFGSLNHLGLLDFCAAQIQNGGVSDGTVYAYCGV